MDYEIPTIDTPPVGNDFFSAIGRAVRIWKKGNAIPLDLAVELMEQGYDVPALEAAHTQPSF